MKTANNRQPAVLHRGTLLFHTVEQDREPQQVQGADRGPVPLCDPGVDILLISNAPHSARRQFLDSAIGPGGRITREVGILVVMKERKVRLHCQGTGKGLTFSQFAPLR